MIFVLDTDVLINLERDELHTIKALNKFASLENSRFAITFVNYAEFYRGALKKSGQYKEDLLFFLDGFLFLGAGKESAIKYAEIKEDLEKSSTPIPEADILIGAIARTSGTTLITYDRHFEKIKNLNAVVLEYPARL